MDEEVFEYKTEEELEKDLDIGDTAENYLDDANLSDSVKQYFLEILQYPLLTPKQEKELTRKMATDDKAKADVINANLRLVIYFAKYYAKSGIPIQDLIQEGNIGLIKSTEKFDPDKGFKFSTYASWWIRHEITKAIAAQQKTIRLPPSVLALLRKINKVRDNFMKMEGRYPSEEEIADILDIPEEKIKRLLVQTQGTVSLDDVIKSEDEDSNEENTKMRYIQNLSAPDPFIQTMNTDMREKLEEVLKELKPKESKILQLRYGFNDGRERTLEEVGKEFNLSKERIRQLEEKSLRNLRRPDLQEKIMENI